MNKISILIPVYNEKEFLFDVLHRVESVDFGLEKEIILIDDCSTDGTKELYSQINYKVIFHEKNTGKGGSLRDGIKEATGDIIIIQDADLEYNPTDYVPLVEEVKNGSADVVYGSRFLNKRDNRFLFLSYTANRFLTFLTKMLYGQNVTDMETCYKVFRSDLIKNIEIKANRFDFEPEITSKLFKNKNIRFKEFPITYDARGRDKGKKINWIDGIQAILTLIRYRF